jgi:methylglutaconyl-CoA hydratase
MRNVEGCSLSFDDGVVEAVIDRGEENLFTTEMCAVLAECLEAPPKGSHLFHLRAAGPAFCLGRERSAGDLATLQSETAALVRLNMAIEKSSLVTIAEVGGNAAGYGVGLVALCDISIAAPSVQLWFPEVHLGLTPSIVLAWLAGKVGKRQALLLTATGTKLGAERAAQIGLITEIASSDQTLSEHVGKCLSTLRGLSPRVHVEIKRFLSVTAGMTSAEAYELALPKLVVAGLERLHGQPI